MNPFQDISTYVSRHPRLTFGLGMSLVFASVFQATYKALPEIDAKPTPANPFDYILISVFANGLVSHNARQFIQNGFNIFAIVGRGLYIGSLAVSANLLLTFYASNLLTIAATQLALGVLTSSALMERNKTNAPASLVAATNLLQLGAASLINLSVLSLDNTLVFKAAAATLGGYVGLFITEKAPQMAEAIRKTVYGIMTVDELEPLAAR